MNFTLVVMAAGIGSRFGGGIKQLEPVGPNGEIIIDYSVYDAIKAGFNKVVFIIRKDLEKDFKEIIGNRIEKICKVEYAFQELDDLPKGFEKPKDRTKPWGTGQAVLACKGIVNEPFVVINADDYYGKEAFIKVHKFLSEKENKNDFNFCMAGFILKNTLSENGSVTRGICKLSDDEMLMEVNETRNIIKLENGAGIKDDSGITVLDENSYVSMNMWGLTPAFIDFLEEDFKEFLRNTDETDLKAEYLVPVIIDSLLKRKKATVKMLSTEDNWFGVTYKEDKQTVVDSFKKLIADGVYKEKLYD